VVEALVSRSLFPALERAVYLDTANDGLVPSGVRADTETFWRASAAGEPGYGEARAGAYERARDAVARLLRADRSLVAVMNSSSEALGSVAWGVPLDRDANVVIVNGDFPTVTYPWLRRARETGIEVRTARRTGAEAGSVEDDIERCIDRRTAFVSVSHVHFATGERLDLARLAAATAAQGALLAVDVAQSAGVVPLDVSRTPADVVVGHAAKWLLGETGAGFCYVSERVLERLDPPVPGWRSVADPWNIDGNRIELALDARRLEVSSVSYSARFELAAAIDFVLGIGVERALDHALRLGAELADGLRALGARVVTPSPAERRAGIVASAFARHAPEELVARLRDVDVHVSARGGLLRWSAHVYNDSRDVARALEHLAAIVHL
jgi:selenocysteine lyase/cysteine desulfurase